MKKLAAAIATIALIGTPAFAATPKKKIIPPPPPPAPVYNWTGWYVGGNVGYSWGRAPTDLAGSATTASGLVNFPSGIFPVTAAFADSNTARLNGVSGGGQIGYNYQFSPNGVLGFEADFQGSGERGSNAFANSFSMAPICFFPPVSFVCGLEPGTLNATALTAYEAKIRWFGTVRGRLGFLVNDQVLLYGTGGLAYGRVELSGVTNVNGSINGTDAGFGIIPLTPAATAFGASKTNVGFSVGGGMEGRLSYWLPPNWTWKLEYLYVDLGSVDTVAPFPGAFAPGFTLPFTGTITIHTHITDNILRVGVNYQFH